MTYRQGVRSSHTKSRGITTTQERANRIRYWGDVPTEVKKILGDIWEELYNEPQLKQILLQHGGMNNINELEKWAKKGFWRNPVNGQNTVVPKEVRYRWYLGVTQSYSLPRGQRYDLIRKARKIQRWACQSTLY